MRTLKSFTVKVDTGHIEILEGSIAIDGEGVEHIVDRHRRVLSPGDGTSGEHDLVKRHAARHWTPEVVAAHRARVEAAEQ